MLTKLGAHFKANTIGYLALIVALSGTTWAAASIGSSQVIDNSLRSVDLKDDAAVKSADVVDDTQPNGGLRSTDLAADEVRAEDIAEEAVGFSELAAGAFNADIAEQGGVFGIPNDGIQGFEVEDGTLGGNDVDESTLTGVVKGRGEAFCCSIRGGILHTEIPYNAGDPATFLDLGNFDLRSTATGNPDRFNLCNPPGGVNFGAAYTVYTGGSSSSSTDTRARGGFPAQGTCSTIDVNGVDTSGIGDFQMWIVERAWEGMHIEGASFGTNTGFTIFAISLH